ncbi:MAG TPA: TIGR04282 family arsenosugar biosynthesis glycosyltransferase [Candidatus Binataceae bacterium]|nr:TIGR04282 family arsenosugar biosynthesis glycosyltransferase [Candidatus Binataceae bacterium]
MPGRPAIIVFTREPLPGSSKTRLAARIGEENAAALADAFNRDALAKARTLKLPLVIAGSTVGDARHNRYFKSLARRFGAHLTDQGLGSLGARMARALAPHESAGAILIGTDTPSLPLKMLQRGVTILRRNRVVLGPSLDGGYYLVGTRGPIPDMFTAIRWGGTRVLAQTVARLQKAKVSFALAPAWYDVDRWSDLMLLAEHLRREPALAAACPVTARALRRLGLLPTGR